MFYSNFFILFFPHFFFKFYKIILVTSRTRKSFYFLLNYFIYSDISELQEKLSSHQKLLLKLYTIFHSSLFFYISQMCSFFYNRTCNLFSSQIPFLSSSDRLSSCLLLFYFFIFLVYCIHVWHKSFCSFYLSKFRNNPAFLYQIHQN